MLDAWPSQTDLKPAFSGLAPLPDHSSMTHNNFCVLSSSRTHQAHSVFERMGSGQLIQEILHSREH